MYGVLDEDSEVRIQEPKRVGTLKFNEENPANEINEEEDFYSGR